MCGYRIRWLITIVDGILLGAIDFFALAGFVNAVYREEIR